MIVEIDTLTIQETALNVIRPAIIVEDHYHQIV